MLPVDDNPRKVIAGFVVRLELYITDISCSSEWSDVAKKAFLPYNRNFMIII
jgi:hypothetical protein